jgi:hypothetical protein
MPARVPQDVDLEDKLVFGLSPIRFGYLVAGVIVGVLIWSGPLPAPLRVLAALPLTTAVILALGRWHGHPIDGLVWDFGLHAFRNYRLELAKDLEALLRVGRRTRDAPEEARVITVTALKPGAGTTTVALELAVALALDGERVSIWESGDQANLRLGLMGPGRHEASGLELLTSFVAPGPRPGILIKAVPPNDPIQPGCHTVMVLTPGSQPPATPGLLPLINRGDPVTTPFPAVPDDPHVQRAETLRESTLIAFPDAPASRTFRSLAASLRQLTTA